MTAQSELVRVRPYERVARKGLCALLADKSGAIETICVDHSTLKSATNGVSYDTVRHRLEMMARRGLRLRFSVDRAASLDLKSRQYLGRFSVPTRAMAEPLAPLIGKRMTAKHWPSIHYFD